MDRRKNPFVHEPSEQEKAELLELQKEEAKKLMVLVRKGDEVDAYVACLDVIRARDQAGEGLTTLLSGLMGRMMEQGPPKKPSS